MNVISEFLAFSILLFEQMRTTELDFFKRAAGKARRDNKEIRAVMDIEKDVAEALDERLEFGHGMRMEDERLPQEELGWT